MSDDHAHAVNVTAQALERGRRHGRPGAGRRSLVVMPERVITTPDNATGELVLEFAVRVPVTDGNALLGAHVAGRVWIVGEVDE